MFYTIFGNRLKTATAAYGFVNCHKEAHTHAVLFVHVKRIPQSLLIYVFI